MNLLPESSLYKRFIVWQLCALRTKDWMAADGKQYDWLFSLLLNVWLIFRMKSAFCFNGKDQPNIQQQ